MFDTSNFEPSLDPFSEKMGHKFYTTPELMQRLNLIRHLTQQSEQLLLVLAEKGYGKTTLATELKSTPGESWWMFGLNSSSALSPDALISSLLDALKVRKDGKSTQTTEMEENLRSHIAAMRYNGQLPVMVVDDAHMLPLATLKLIVELNIRGEPQTRMRVLLFCEPQITSILATPELQAVHSTLIHTLDIPPLSQAQVLDYVKFRLKNGQYGETHPFHSEMIKDIYLKSGGVPGKINTISQQILGKSATQQTQRHFFDMSSYAHYKKWVVGFIMIALLLGGSLLAYWRYSNSTNVEENEENQVIENTIPALPVVEPLAIEIEESNETALTEDEMAIEPPSDNTNANLVETKKTETTIAIANVENTESTDLSKDATSPLKNAAWLRAQNPKSFTLQILGTHNPLTVETFITKYSLNNDVAQFKTKHLGKDWYVLVFGIYNSRAQADSALKQLPIALQQNTSPWVRSISSIQNLIKEE